MLLADVGLAPFCRGGFDKGRTATETLAALVATEAGEHEAPPLEPTLRSFQEFICGRWFAADPCRSRTVGEQ